jgi:hypothetical protein
MVKLTAEEFQDRLQAYQRATRIFGHFTDQNITIAFQAYQAILAEQERELEVASWRMQGMTGSEMDKYERVACPDCNADMFFRIVPPNIEGVVTQLVCTNCDLVLDTDKSMADWKETLRRTDGQ